MKKKNYKLLIEGWRNFINEEHSGDDLFDSDHHRDVEVEDVVTDRAVVDTEEHFMSEEDRLLEEERKKYLEKFCEYMGIKCDKEAMESFIRRKQIFDVDEN